MNKFVVYSALVGAYDEVPQPIVIDERFDFILFTNEIKEKTVGVWQVRSIEYENTDTTRTARFVKTHPELLLSEYTVSVWIDMNVIIKTNYLYERIVQLVSDGILVSSMCHPDRDCIYEEAFALMHMRVEREYIVLDWCRHLYKERYPQHNGLCETNVLFRQHNMPEVVAFDAYWWDCIQNNSRRDQLSFNYTLWKKKIPCHYMIGYGKCVRNCEHFSIVEHKDVKHNFCDLNNREGWLMRYCWKVPSETEKIKKIYYKLYNKFCPGFWAFLLGQIYRVKYLLAKANGN